MNAAGIAIYIASMLVVFFYICGMRDDDWISHFKLSRQWEKFLTGVGILICAIFLSWPILNTIAAVTLLMCSLVDKVINLINKRNSRVGSKG